jgi:hypothetical protein
MFFADVPGGRNIHPPPLKDETIAKSEYVRGNGDRGFLHRRAPNSTVKRAPGALDYTLNLNTITSPSFTMYSLPSMR